jgi:hypothetical protein
MSYFLSPVENLGDIVDLKISRKNLNIGPLDNQNADDIHIYNANISTNNFKFIAHGSSTLKKYTSYIKSYDNNGTCIWFINDGWISDDNINLSNFFFDVDLPKKEHLNNSALSGNFNDFRNTPTTNDVLDKIKDIVPLLHLNSNLQDIQSIHKDTLTKSLQVGDMVFQNIDSLMVTGLSVEKFYYHNIDTKKNMNNCYLRSENDDILINGLRTNKTKWFDLFLNDDGLLKNEFKLDTSYKNANINNTVTANTLKNMYDATLLRFNEKKQHVDKQHLLNTLSNYAVDGIFVRSSNLLNEDKFETSLCRFNLNLGNVSTQDDSNVSFLNLSVTNDLTFDMKSYLYDLDDLFLTCKNNNGDVQLSNLKIATTEHLGFVKFVYDFESPENPVYGVMNWKNLKKKHTSFNRIINNFKSQYYQNKFTDYIDDINLLDTNLSQFKSITNDISSSICENLELLNISYSGDFTHLNTYPTSIHAFENDIFLINRFQNCIGMHENAASNTTNLGCGNLSIQNKHSVLIESGDAVFKVVETDQLYIYPNQFNIINKWLQVDDQNQIIYADLPIFSENNYGVVKKLNNFNTIGDTYTVSITSFKQMYDLLLEKIEDLDNRIHSFLV